MIGQFETMLSSGGRMCVFFDTEGLKFTERLVGVIKVRDSEFMSDGPGWWTLIHVEVNNITLEG